MKLRIEQVQRLCGIEPKMRQLVFDALLRSRFLYRNSDQTHVLRDGSELRLPPVKAALKSTRLVTTARRAG